MMRILIAAVYGVLLAPVFAWPLFALALDRLFPAPARSPLPPIGSYADELDALEDPRYCPVARALVDQDGWLHRPWEDRP